MSYPKIQFKSNIMEPVIGIVKNTLDDNDFTKMMEWLNTLLTISENVGLKDEEIGSLMQEVSSDCISSIYIATSGFYRQAVIQLRSILEVTCNAFYYLDHKIEYNLFMSHNAKSDRYVSKLVNDHHFYTTRYITAFFGKIQEIQTETDSVSKKLTTLYGDLSDIVHGRSASFTKLSQITIGYSKEKFKFFEVLLHRSLSLIVLLYALRFDDFITDGVLDLAKFTMAVRV